MQAQNTRIVLFSLFWMNVIVEFRENKLHEN